jgi:hypothetical protein
LFLAVVQVDADGYRIRARELDCRTLTWGPVVERRTGQLALVAAETFRAVEAAFAPVARIEDVRGRSAIGRIRAGGLIVEDDSPAMIAPGFVLQPVVRRNDRFGNARPGGIQKVPWTLLQVASRADSVIQCEVVSGSRNPLRGRSSSRTERLAIAVRPSKATTTVRLESQEEPPQALAGYELYAKELSPGGGDASGKDDASAAMRFVGRTDWRGIIEAPPSDEPLQVLYVKNGGRVLARLPLVPGLEAQLTAQLPNDDLRMQAESCVRGFQTTIMDLVARRAVLRERIGRLAAEGKSAEAEELIEQFRSLTTRAELTDLLNEQRSRFAAADGRLQEKVDQLFADTESLMGKYLDPAEPDRLQAKLAARNNE